MFGVVNSDKFARLPTEQNNSASRRIDQVSVLKALQIINKEDHKPAQAVARALPRLTDAVNLIVNRLRGGGKLFFLGAGTSGRLGVLEAAECPPTFNTPRSLVQAYMAGGKMSVFRSKEGAEDRGTDAARIVRRHVDKKDVVVGIAASGVTAFVKDGLKTARQKRAGTILVTCFPKVSPTAADVIVGLHTGPEVIAGSTRLKAGTATKLALNSLTVASMVQLGKVYRNWMVDLQPRSKKLTARATRLIQKLGQVSEKQAVILLKSSGGNAKTAILMARKNITAATAKQLLKKNGGLLHKALA